MSWFNVLNLTGWLKGGTTETPVTEADPLPVTGPLTNDQLRNAPVETRDQFLGLEILERQTAAADQVLVFSFDEPVDIFYVYSEDHQNHQSHVSIGPNADPSATFGVPILPGVPQSFPVRAQTVKVYENQGGIVTVWGYRYG